MKYFVFTVLRLYGELAEIYDALDKTALSAALSVTRDAEELCEYLMDLNDKKRIVANLKVLYDKIVSAAGDDAEALISYALGLSTEEIAEKENVNRSTAARRVGRATEHGIRALGEAGVDEKKIENEYFTLPLIKTVYDKAAARTRTSFSRHSRAVSSFSLAARVETA